MENINVKKKKKCLFPLNASTKKILLYRQNLRQKRPQNEKNIRTKYKSFQHA